MKTRISVKNGGVKAFDIIEIPGSSDKFRRLFSTGERILLQGSENTRSVVRSNEKYPDGAIKNGKCLLRSVLKTMRMLNCLVNRLPAYSFE